MKKSDRHRPVEPIQQKANGAPAHQAPLRPTRGLSTKLLALTILFVMLGEVLIYVPSIANFRVTWLRDRLAVADVAALVLDAAPDNMVPPNVRDELLDRAGAKAIAVKRGNTRTLMLQPEVTVTVDEHFDLRSASWWENIVDAFGALFAGNGRVIRVVDSPLMAADEVTDIVIDETPLRKAMFNYSFNILTLSIVLSLLVAGCVFLVLNNLMVKPIRRMTRAMLRYSEDPEDPGRVIQPSGRTDEIGTAETELQNMQSELSNALQQKNRLAALGLAVSKISHDLRNMLASAQVISDRLILVDDPTVKKFAPKLINSLDRAIDFCVQTLKYGRVQEPEPRRDQFFLRMVVDDVIDNAAPQTSSRVVLYNDVPKDVKIDADREQIFRLLMNLVRNAAEAVESNIVNLNGVEGAVHIDAWRESTLVTIEVCDNGPGVSEKARVHLFEAFQGSAKAGGTGLGLAIAAELARAHGGDVSLRESDEGACFWVTIPDSVRELSPGRRGEVEHA
ncbi:MAG: sensor histidine kinase [Hyphomicrobiales bacterium]